MPYYTRVFTKRADCPSQDDLAHALAAEHPSLKLCLEDGDAFAWNSLVLSHPKGAEIAAIERSVVTEGSLGAREIEEFVEDVRDCRPASAVPWLTSFLKSVKVIYAFQHLSGTEHARGDEALRVLSASIWSRGDAIMQADGEGFSNEDGYHILWQFSDSVSGTWWMAVQLGGKWMNFQMDLGNPAHRQAFLEGRVPSDVSTA